MVPGAPRRTVRLRGVKVRRIKADAYTHVHGKPLKVLDGEDPFQRSFDCFGKTYRDRLTEVEREVAWQRTHLFNKTTGAVRRVDDDDDVSMI